MRIHVIYDESGRIISGLVEEFPPQPDDPRAVPVPGPGQRAATFKLADELAPSPEEFVRSARVEEGPEGPRLRFSEDPDGSASQVVGPVRSPDSEEGDVAPPAPVGPGAAEDGRSSTGGLPWSAASFALDLMLANAAERRPELADFGYALRDVALAPLQRVYCESLPELGAEIVRLFELPPAASRRLELELTDGLPAIPMGPVTTQTIEASYTAALEAGELDPELLERSFYGGLIDEFDVEDDDLRGERDDYIRGGGGDDMLIDHGKKAWVKVGTLERRSRIPVYAGGASGGSPLNCHEPATGNDEPKGSELAYVGDMKPASLTAPPNSVARRQDVDRGWGQDVFDEDRQPGYWEEVAVGYKPAFYHWFLCQPGWIDKEWFEKGVVEAQKKIKEKQKDIQEKVEKLAKESLQGTIAAPAAPLAGKLAAALASYVTDYLVEMMTAKRFDAVNLAHTTVMKDDQSPPLSIVSLTAEGNPVQLWRDEGTGAHPRRFTQNYRRPGVDSVARSWTGASQFGPNAPAIKHEVAEAGCVVVWRKSVDGFGAFIPQRYEQGRYVTLVRADVRLVDESSLPEPV